MNNVLKIILSLSLSGSFLILLLFFCKPFIKSKLSRQWQYYVWFIVIARLLLPFAPVGNLMNKTFEAIGNTYSSKIQSAQSSPVDYDIEIPVSEEIRNVFTENIVPSEDSPGHQPIQEAFRLLVENYWLVWLAVAAIMLIRKITIYKGFVRYIKAGMQPVSNIELLDRVAVIGKQININKPIELCVNPLISSPLLFGFFHPCIVIPSTNLSDKDFHYTVLHELTHYKRRDMFYKWLVQITICLHWFNPCVYLMGWEINRACEFACDEAIITKLGSDDTQDYGKTLLEAMASVGKYKEALASVTLSENKKLLKERLEAIMSFQKKSRLVLCATILLTVLLLCGFTFVGAYDMTDFQVGIPPAPMSPSIDSQFAGTVITPSGSSTNKSKDNSQTSSSNKVLTAKADSYKIIDSPNLDIRIKSATVNVKPASDKQVAVEYNSDIFNAIVKNIDGNWSVDISSKLQYTNSAPMVTLYLPEYQYGKINLDVEIATMNFPVKSGEITAHSYLSNVDVYLQEGFTGSLTHVLDGGNLFVNSANAYRNSKVKITNEANITGTVLVPDKFTKNGKVYTYSNGTQNNIVDITLNEFGVVSLQSEGDFPSPPTSNKLDPDLKGTAVINLNSNGQKSLIHSSSFKASAGQVLTLEIKSTISGTVDLFLFSPSYQEQRITIGGSNDTKIINLSAGTWAYNCTGFFDSGKVSIIGTISPVDINDQSKPLGSKDVDAAALHVMQYSHSWDIVEPMLPYMTKDGINTVVMRNNEVNPNATKRAADYYNLARPSQAETDNRAYSIMEKTGNWKYASPLFPYMSNAGIDKVVALYNQKTGKSVNASNYYNNKNDYRPDPNAPEPDIYGGEAIELQG